MLCAAEAADKLSLANAIGASGKQGFWNGLANGFFGNTISTVVEYAYGGSSTELVATAYDYGTGASEGAVNAMTGSAPMTDLGLGGSSQATEGAATEGLGGVVAGMKIAYDAGTFLYGAVKCY